VLNFNRAKAQEETKEIRNGRKVSVYDRRNGMRKLIEGQLQRSKTCCRCVSAEISLRAHRETHTDRVY
jgi:hypothetical protein